MSSLALRPYSYHTLVAKPFLILLHSPHYALKQGHLTWNPQHTFLLKPKLILCFPQQNPKRPVAQVLSWDHKPLHLLSHAHSKAPSRYAAAAAAGEGEVPLQELDALLAAIAAAASGRNCQLLPFFQHLLEPHHLCDLVGLLRIHGFLWWLRLMLMEVRAVIVLWCFSCMRIYRSWETHFNNLFAFILSANVIFYWLYCSWL